MIRPSDIHPDVDLRNFLQGRISVGTTGGGTKSVPVYGDWERDTNNPPSDFVVIFMNGDIESVGMNVDFAEGHIMVSLYSKMNNDGSVKKNRISKILAQFDELIEGVSTGDYFYKYDHQRFITPTTPNANTGYSVTTLNLKWHTINNFNLL